MKEQMNLEIDMDHFSYTSSASKEKEDSASKSSKEESSYRPSQIDPNSSYESNFSPQRRKKKHLNYKANSKETFNLLVPLQKNNFGQPPSPAYSSGYVKNRKVSKEATESLDFQEDERESKDLEKQIDML